MNGTIRNRRTSSYELTALDYMRLSHDKRQEHQREAARLRELLATVLTPAVRRRVQQQIAEHNRLARLH